MKTKTLLSIALASLALAALSACEPKNEPRWNQEGAKVWTPAKTPVDAEVQSQDFNQFDLNKAYAELKSSGDLTKDILIPLSKIVLNRKFIEDPRYRTLRMSKMVSVFNAAFAQEYVKPHSAAEFGQIKEDYYQTVFSGCTRDLEHDCMNADLFASDGRFTEIMTLFAREEDPKIEAALKTAPGPNECMANEQAAADKFDAAKSKACHDLFNLVEERYRRLAMGVFKRNRYQDSDFTFAYLKYARLFALDLEFAKVAKGETSPLSVSYLSQVHTKIFETLIAKYSPKDLNNTEFRAFVENFNPWSYSRKQADLFHYGTGVMFELGAKCCLYQDSSKTKLSKSVTDAIMATQKDKDDFGPSFLQMIDEIRKEYDNQLFKNLGLSDLISAIDRPDHSFFNEYFFIVDRLFRGHLSNDDIAMMLRNTNQERAKSELPVMISNYVKVYLVYMVLQTNHFMADKVYHSNLASDQVFEQAILRSHDLTDKWYKIQAQIDLLDTLMRSYFKDQLISSPQYVQTTELIQAINRNVHYLSVFPSMIVMNYYLAKMKGSLSFDSWWGRITINADTILKAFFDGEIGEPWFHFGKDLEPLDRLNLLYSLEYLLSTESLKSFVATENGNGAVAGSDRSKFFDMIFTQYLGDSLDDLRKSINDYQKSTFGDPNFPNAKAVCDYEMNPNKGPAPRVTINLLDLDRYTYTGLGDNSINGVLNKYLTGAQSTARDLLEIIDYRKTYVQAMIDVIEGDLIRRGQIAKAGDPHPDLDKARLLIKQLNDLQTQLRQMFLSKQKEYFNCAIRLREVERRRTNRLYDEERAHLGKIYDLLQPLAQITDSAQLDAKVKEINDGYFRAKDSGYTFDRLDGMNYRMSKFDLFMRMKKRIEDDVFVNPTAKEAKNYGASLQEFVRPRSVSVYMPDGYTRSDMYAQGTSISVPFKGDREQFIRDGMAALNGKSDAFIQWQGQMEKDTTLATYLNTLEEFYLMPKADGDTSNLEVTPKDLTDAYIQVLAGFSMDAYDLENAADFQTYGRHPKDFFQDKLFDRDGMTRLWFFSMLMTDVYNQANIGLESTTKGSPVVEALDFAKRFSALQATSTQAFVFQPSNAVQDALQRFYGARANARLNRVSELYSYLEKRESEVTDATSLDPRLGQPLYLENGVAYQWYSPGSKNLVDPQRLSDDQILIRNFIQRTGDFFETKEKVKVP